MRVLLTTDTVGGVWTFTQELVSGLLARGHEICLVALGRAASGAQQEWLDSTSASFPQQFQAECFSVPLEWMDGNGAAYEKGAAELLRLARAFRPDLLHSSQFCFGALPTSFPRLITAHSDVLSWARTCRPQGVSPSPWLTTYVELVQAGLRGAHAVTAPTDWMMRALRDGYPTLPAKQAVIANGRTLPEVPSAIIRKPQAVSVGRLWDEGKNVRILAETKSPWPLLVAGDRQFGEAASQALGFVRMLGPLKTGDLLALFAASSVYICTSLYEPFGLAPLEAALSGCALLLHDLPSLRELWGDAVLYFRNAAELSALLNRLARSPERLRAAQGAARKRAMHFTAERMVENYLLLYEEVLRDTESDTVKELARDAA